MNIISKFFIAIFLLISSQAFGQGLNLPRISPFAKVSQKIGLSEVEITYSRPHVNGRIIWGGLVPYNLVWRAGANENTTVSFSTDAKINGNFIPAGKYGFHIIPTTDEWTLIFSKHNNSWGSFFYDPKADQLRIKVKPIENRFCEILTYGFDAFTDSSTKMFLEWEKIRVEVTVEFDVKNVTLNSIREQLRSIPGFGWQGPLEAAEYCVKNKINFDEALKWIDLSISRKESKKNYFIKAELLSLKKEFAPLEKLLNKIDESYTLDEYDLIHLGNFYLQLKSFDEAIDHYERCLKIDNENWNALKMLGDTYSELGNEKEAKFYYKKASEIAPEKIKIDFK